MFFRKHELLESNIHIMANIIDELGDAIEILAKEVKELREEVDYLVDFLDD